MAKRRPAARLGSKPLSAKNADWAFHADDAEVFDALARGRHTESLREYFGAPAYAELSILAAEARRRRKKIRGPKILILPGIMGSKLGGRLHPARAKHRARTPAVLWIDPLQIAAGRLTALALPSARPLKPMGVLLFSYAKLKLKLQIAGCDVSLYSYDWRLGLDELGAKLAQRIARDGRRVILVAHSMGGLIARAAARTLPKRLLRKLVMLGTPNQGSFAPVQALRGTYPFVRNMSTLDRKHSAEYLTQHVFCTFPGLYHMLPPPQRLAGIDLFDARSWPSDGPIPNAHLLGQVATIRAGLAPVDSRMVHIIGVNQETVVGLRRTAAGFEYAMDRNGDGTVPLALARLPKLKCYFVDESHADLANNSRVIQAVLDIVRGGRTTLLPERWRAKPGVVRRTDDAQLRLEGTEKIDWRRLSPAQREAVFAALDSGRLLPAARHPVA
jgi:pimeloyl-ACP methyl ester carboxylesterase